MNIIKTLGFAAVAALSLGVGAAMAQVDGVDAGAAGFPANSPAMTAPAARPAAVQSGSSDVDSARPATMLPGNYYDVGTGGSSGG
ncbi:MAG TPA: hypothetical protein VHX39_16020 [Acetobacteraceae bacterium]|nr:hypothetical protein [Acetobacteraceae bacterium]